MRGDRCVECIKSWRYSRIAGKDRGCSRKGLEKKIWTMCGVIKSCLTQDLKYHVMSKSSAKMIWEILESKYLTKSVENPWIFREGFIAFSWRMKSLLVNTWTTTPSFLHIWLTWMRWLKMRQGVDLIVFFFG